MAQIISSLAQCGLNSLNQTKRQWSCRNIVEIFTSHLSGLLKEFARLPRSSAPLCIFFKKLVSDLEITNSRLSTHKVGYVCAGETQHNRI